MRRIFSLAAVSVLALFVALQPVRAQGVGFGVEAGLNVSDLSVDDDGESVNLDAETGYRAGAVLRWNFAPVLGFQTGASFSQKGATSDTEALTQEIQIDYLEIPLLLQINIPTGPVPVNPRIFGGGTFNFELTCDQTLSDGTGSVEAACSADELGDAAIDTKSVDVGLLFGGGLDFPAGPGAFTVDVRFDLGLSDINDVVDSPTELKNRNFQATAGYVILVP